MFSFFLWFYVLLAVYCGVRLYMLFGAFLPLILQNKLIFAALIVLLAFSYIILRTIYRSLNDMPPSGLYYFAALFFALYLIMLALLIIFDVLLLATRLFPSVYAYVSSHMAFVGLLYLAMTVVIYASGLFNANSPAESRYVIPVAKKLSQDIRIVQVSDIHVTGYTRKASMEKLVNRLNKLDADIVVFVGDVIDGEPQPYEEKDIASIFRGVKSHYGVYGVLGNHEYYGEGIDKALALLSDSGITMLRDSVAVIETLNLSLIGRDDLAASRRGGVPRKSIEELAALAKDDSVFVVLDHQPQRAMEAKEAGADIQLSGHTHNGQIFPANFIVKAIYDNPWGHKVYDAFHLIVSCGYGTWGPPMRTRSFSEIVVIEITGE